MNALSIIYEYLFRGGKNINVMSKSGKCKRQNVIFYRGESSCVQRHLSETIIYIYAFECFTVQLLILIL